MHREAPATRGGTLSILLPRAAGRLRDSPSLQACRIGVSNYKLVHPFFIVCFLFFCFFFFSELFELFDYLIFVKYSLGS